MTTTDRGSRLPLYLLLLGGFALGIIGTYTFMSRQTTGVTTQGTATEQADSAAAVAGMNAADRTATEAIVRAYILEHPEIITEAVAILQGREIGSRLTGIGPALSEAFAGNVAGSPSGDVTIVEFTDYNCGYCRSSVADVERLLKTDKKIRLIYRELPILAPSSRDAALWALAAAKQGKHDAFHKAMFAAGKPDEPTIMMAAENAGLDFSAALQFVKTPEAKAEIESNLAMMQKIGFGGTPTFVIGDQILEGAQGYERLKSAVAAARKAS
jgi:protein-disulfide isomerase